MAGEKLNEWVGRLPELEDGRRFPAVEREVAEEIYGELLAMDGGVKELVSGLTAVDDGGDWKVRFLIRGLVNFVGGVGRGEAKGKVEVALVDEAGDRGKEAAQQAFLLEQVRWISSEGTLERVAEMLGEEDAMVADAAAAVIVATGGEAAKVALRAALGRVAAERRGVVENALRQVG